MELINGIIGLMMFAIGSIVVGIGIITILSISAFTPIEEECQDERAYY